MCPSSDGRFYQWGHMLGFKSTVISGVLSTLLASIFTWLFGYWPHVWSFIVEVASTAWWVVSYSVPMPMSVLVLLWFFLMYVVYRLRSISGQAGAATTDGMSTKPTQGLSEMSEKELAVMGALAAADGQWLGIEHISSRIQAPRLLTEQTLERLLARELLLQSMNYIHGSSFRLSPLGRDYAIDQGYVK